MNFEWERSPLDRLVDVLVEWTKDDPLAMVIIGLALLASVIALVVTG